GGYAVKDGARPVWILPQRPGVVSRDVSGRDGIDIDARMRPLVRERFGHAGERVLGRGVADDVYPALEAQQRRGEDDLSAAARDHPGPDRLGEDERRGEVDLDHVVPGLERMLRRRLPVDDPGVADEDVDGTVKLVEPPEQPVHGRAVAEVGGHRPELAARGFDAAPGFAASTFLRCA